MKYTEHANVRSQQSSIPEDIIDLILLFGTPIPKPHYATEYRILKKDISNVMRQLKHIQNSLEKASKKGVLVSNDNHDVITVYNINK